MSERKASYAIRRVNDFIDGKGMTPSVVTLTAAASDALSYWNSARQSGDREAERWAIGEMRNIADVMEDISDGRGER